MEFAEGIKTYMESLHRTIDSVDIGMIDSAISLILGAYESGSSIYIMGNGGSAATASHLACDYNKGLSLGSDRRFDMICLCDNMASVMAYANDCGYENIFLYQLQGKLKKGDILVCISGSGNSINVVKAAEYAREHGNAVITMTGYSGGKLKGISDCPIHVPINDMQKVEDCHMIVGHLMAQIIGRKLNHPLC